MKPTRPVHALPLPLPRPRSRSRAARETFAFQAVCKPGFVAAVTLVLSLGGSGKPAAAEYLNGIRWDKPAIVTPGKENADPPSDAVVLFDGSDLSHWIGSERWEVRDGNMVVGKGAIKSKEQFGDCQVHLEWSAPTPAKGDGQGRGNSGVFLMGIYEVQILDSFDNATYFDGQAAAIYKQTPPAVNATRPPGQWNTYDIFWTAPRFGDDGGLKSPAHVTVVHNGVLVQNHFPLLGDTPFNRPPRYKPHPAKGPIGLQDHGNPIRFRNIWVRPFNPATGVRQRAPFLRDRNGKTTPVETKEAR